MTTNYHELHRPHQRHAHVQTTNRLIFVSIDGTGHNSYGVCVCVCVCVCARDPVCQNKVPWYTSDLHVFLFTSLSTNLITVRLREANRSDD